ncbi:hypothetical protein HMPREF9148_02254 [Prevotella sp. F0091]|nr:hypothetical protein HMPREF9148_02254 [Prevotella sp. F0091]
MDYSYSSYHSFVDNKTHTYIRKLTRADTVFLSCPLKVLKESTASAPAFYKHYFRVEQTSRQRDLALTSAVSVSY